MGDVYREHHRFSFPTAIHFGCGVRKAVAEDLRERGVRRPLIVTDRGLLATPVPGELQKFLSVSGAFSEVSLFGEIFGNPTKDQVVAGVTAYRAAKADGIVALGGGAAVDVAKAIALLIHHPGDLFEYEDGLPGAKPIDRAIPPLVALPTTAGTGSEVGRSTVISDSATKRKKIIFSPRLLPLAVFADPELTFGLPPAITAATGMDALTHCVEAYLAKDFHPICEAIAIDGVRRVALHLPKAVAHGHDVGARSEMLLSSMMGAIAFQKGLGVVHSCAHALSTVCDLHHGLANGIMMPFALSVNRDVAGEKFGVLARSIGRSTADAKNGFQEFHAWLLALRASIRIPHSLKEVGVNRSHLPALLDVALSDVCHQNNPRPVDKVLFISIFEEALA